MSMMSNREIKEKMRQQLNDDNFLTTVTKKAFDDADKNKNGTIDIRELKACMIDIAQGIGKDIPEEELFRNEFYKLDKDRNNTVDFDEFKIFVKTNMLMLIDMIPDN